VNIPYSVVTLEKIVSAYNENIHHIIILIAKLVRCYVGGVGARRHADRAIIHDNTYIYVERKTHAIVKQRRVKDQKHQALPCIDAVNINK